jgi:hypothetical protein
MLNHLKLKHSSDDLYEETELSLYKRERCDPNVNPFKWWKENDRLKCDQAFDYGGGIL